MFSNRRHALMRAKLVMEETILHEVWLVMNKNNLGTNTMQEVRNHSGCLCSRKIIKHLNDNSPSPETLNGILQM